MYFTAQPSRWSFITSYGTSITPDISVIAAVNAPPGDPEPLPQTDPPPPVPSPPAQPPENPVPVREPPVTMPTQG